MRDLLPSGRFAQLARFSRKALRLYAEIGLLRPVFTNADNGYHYYSLDQLEEARRIAQLRELGMSLEAIREALHAWNSPDFKGHLERHREQLLEQVNQVQGALRALDTLLSEPPATYSVSVKAVNAQTYIGVRAWCHPDEACKHVGAVQARLLKELERLGLRPAGACLAQYHDEQEEAWDVEVCIPVGERPSALNLSEGVCLAELPAGWAASTVHAGDCGGNHGMQGAYAAVWNWVREHGHETLGGPLEVYLLDETNTARVSDYRTEIAWMLRPG